MNKNDVKRILISLRNNDNEEKINNLLGKIDLLSEEDLQKIVAQIGNTEESIKRYIQEKLIQTQDNLQEKHTPINKMFEYGLTRSCIHLHMPIDLHEMISKIGLKKTMDTVNLYLLDAIEKIRVLQNNGFYKFEGRDSIYLISPILIGREMKFLEKLDFETRSYRKKDMQNQDFVAEHPEAQLAVNIFGLKSSIGTAKISFDVINSQQWQIKRREKVKQFEEEGILLEEDTKSKNE